MQLRLVSMAPLCRGFIAVFTVLAALWANAMRAAERVLARQTLLFRLEPWLYGFWLKAASYTKRTWRTAVLFFALSGIAAAQTPVQLDFGVRGGVLANHSFQANQLCSDAGCIFGTRSFTAEGLRGTVGPTIGVLLYDRVEVRFEAVHRRFGYQIQTDVDNAIETDRFVETVRGHVWEYPLIATYHFGSGPGARPYVGGGVSLGVKGRYTAGFLDTTTRKDPSGPVTTTSFGQRAGDLFGLPTGYYVIGGVDARVSYFSIRPEFRYTHFPKDRVSTAEAILTPNQFEFLIGISIHSFRTKK